MEQDIRFAAAGLNAIDPPRRAPRCPHWWTSHSFPLHPAMCSGIASCKLNFEYIILESDGVPDWWSNELAASCKAGCRRA
jgi:hypothetical protein